MTKTIITEQIKINTPRHSISVVVEKKHGNYYLDVSAFPHNFNPIVDKDFYFKRTMVSKEELAGKLEKIKKLYKVN